MIKEKKQKTVEEETVYQELFQLKDEAYFRLLLLNELKLIRKQLGKLGETPLEEDEQD